MGFTIDIKEKESGNVFDITFNVKNTNVEFNQKVEVLMKVDNKQRSYLEYLYSTDRYRGNQSKKCRIYHKDISNLIKAINNNSINYEEYKFMVDKDTQDSVFGFLEIKNKKLIINKHISDNNDIKFVIKITNMKSILNEFQKIADLIS